MWKCVEGVGSSGLLLRSCSMPLRQPSLRFYPRLPSKTLHAPPQARRMLSLLCICLLDREAEPDGMAPRCGSLTKPGCNGACAVELWFSQWRAHAPIPSSRGRRRARETPSPAAVRSDSRSTTMDVVALWYRE